MPTPAERGWTPTVHTSASYSLSHSWGKLQPPTFKFDTMMQYSLKKLQMTLMNLWVGLLSGYIHAYMQYWSCRLPCNKSGQLWSSWSWTRPVQGCPRMSHLRTSPPAALASQQQSRCIRTAPHITRHTWEQERDARLHVSKQGCDHFMHALWWVVHYDCKLLHV